MSKYYIIDRDFLLEYPKTFGNKAKLGIAYYEDIPVAAGIFLNGGDIYHYHFSASHPDYLNMNAISLLLMEEAYLGAQEGCIMMDLGGATPGSGLEKFKKSLVRDSGTYRCYVGKKIRNNSVYDALVAERGISNTKFFPAYRA